MIYLQLLYSFFKIGLFAFGGGYAMISMIQGEIELHGWLSASEFIDIIAISEMTPGPIAVNSATFVGFKVAGLGGSAAATLGVALPSLIIILSISGIYMRFQRKPLSRKIFYGVRPAVTGLVAAACIFVARTALLRSGLTFAQLGQSLLRPGDWLSLGGVAIAALSLVALKRKAHPILIIAGAAAAGILLGVFFPSLLPV
ncbi:MAG: chromate transporter [Clostridiales bacterium]|nr:chromate transporter [Clostridiales bacterium]